MHSAIFVAATPDDSHQERAKWGVFLSGVQSKLKDPKNPLQLAENVWLANVRQSPASLAWLVSLAENQSIKYGLLSFDDEPQWLPAGFDPKTIQVQNG
jgi:hypothetical protein